MKNNEWEDKMPRRLYLVRHGETNANFFKIIDGGKTNAFYGHGDSLNCNGLWQARLLGQALAEVKINHIYTSLARRAIETADHICLWTNACNRPFKRSVNKELAEINFGILEGYSGQKAREKYPDLFKSYYKKPTGVAFPKGECVVVAYNRVSRTIEEICAAHDYNENVLIVSHGGVMAFIFIHIFKLDLDTIFHSIRHHNCGLSIIEWENPNNMPKIVCVNDISHLKSEHAQRLKEPLSPFLSGS